MAYNQISVTVDNTDPQTFNVNQNDRVFMAKIVAADSQADNVFALMSILAYAKIVGREAKATYKIIEQWVEDHNVWIEAEAPKVTRTADTSDTSSE